MKIKHIVAREVFNSLSQPTVQCEIFLEDGRSVISMVPAGVSVGQYEAVDLRDGGERFEGLGVSKAIENIERFIAPQLIGQEPNGIEMDIKMLQIDGTQEKSRLGANAILAVSMAVYRAEALVQNVELFELIASVMGHESVSLPLPLFNMINGGLHANNGMFAQEFLVMPLGLTNFRTALESGVIFYQELKKVLKKRKKPIVFGDEGGFAPNFTNINQALDILVEVIDILGSSGAPRSYILGLDIAASQFYDVKTQKYKIKNKNFDSDQMLEFYQDLISQYPLFYLEDALSDQDWDSWPKMVELFKNKIQIVGDDIFATNIFRIAKGFESGVANSVIIKPNQAGTIGETLQAIKLCHDLQLNPVMSHRSGETEDSFITDLAVGANCSQIKSGGLRGSERLAKYNRLLRIEDCLVFDLFSN